MAHCLRKCRPRRHLRTENVEVISARFLSDKQRLFCLYYTRCFNATKAYQKAFECSYINACGNGSGLLKNIEIRREIERLKEDRFTQTLLKADDIVRKYIDIAFSDITDYLTFGQEEVPILDQDGEPVMREDPETGEMAPLTRMVNRVGFLDSSEVDGTLISEVRNGRDGAFIKLIDREKALKWLADHMDLLTEEQKARIEKMRSEASGAKSEAVDDWIEAIAGEAQPDE